MRRLQLVIDDTGSVEGIYAFIYCTKWRSGQVSPMPHSLTDSRRKDSATQLLINYKIGALVTQFDVTENDKRKQPAAQPRPRQSERFHLAAARRRSWLLACCQDHHYQSLVTSSRVHTFTFSFFDRIPMI